MTIGERIKQARLKAGLDIPEAARKAGLNRAYWWRVENNQHDPGYARLERIAEAVGVPLSDLVDGATVRVESKGEEVLLSLYRSLPADRQRWVVQQLAAMAAGMEAIEDFRVPDDALAAAS